ncbi:6 kDa protein [Human adenovirus 1]|nr:6 kDa protein [Human adenovirus 1]
MRHIICHGGVITEEMAASLLDQLIEEVLCLNLSLSPSQNRSPQDLPGVLKWCLLS